MKYISGLVLGAFFLLAMTVNSVAETNRALNVKNIPDSLEKNADAVVRNYRQTIDVKSADEIVVTEHYEITILNKNGYNYSILKVPYDKFGKVKSISGKIYDRNGNELKKVRKYDIEDKAIYNDGAIMNDYRYKYYDCGYAGYPFTCVYDVETVLSASLSLPTFFPIQGYRCALQNATWDITYPASLHFRYRKKNIPTAVVSNTIQSNEKHLQLSVGARMAVENPDDLFPDSYSSLPKLYVVCDQFEIGDWKGDLSTWKGFGKFYYDLNVNRDQLPDDVKNKVHQLTDTCHTAYEKMNLLYRYLQANTRYVGIQLGIGGFQTYDAKYVAAKGYGDCKALSNYMMSLLKEAGIKAYPLLIHAGTDDKSPVVKAFPYDQFNHVILCVPSVKDTVWLECTAKFTPAGYLSSFTSNRDALFIDSSGGYLVKTPGYAKVNTLSRSATIAIDNNDQLKGKISMKYNGFFWDKEHMYANYTDKRNFEDHLNSEFLLPNYQITDYHIDKGVKNTVPYIKEDVTLSGAPNISRTTKRIFLAPDMLKIEMPMPLNTVKRTIPFEIRHSYQVQDTITINVDGDYSAESLPDEKHMNYPFAKYDYKIVFDDGHTLKLIRSYSQIEGIYPAKMFSDYLVMAKAVNYSAEHNKVILQKKE